MVRGGLLGPLASVTLPTCEKYLAGKSTRKPFGKAKRTSTPLDLIHFNICEPFNVKARNGCSNYISLLSMIFRDTIMFI